MSAIEDAVVDKKIIQKVIDNIDYNKIIIDYYEKFTNDHGYAFSLKTLENNVKRMKSCNKYWMLDKYERQKIKDFKGTILCRDKFCANCKKVKQSARMAKYIPALEQYKDRLYHLTLTLPNCKGEELIYTYRKMARAFKYLVQYFRGEKKTKDIDFSFLGYEGAVRSLEVTFDNSKENPYHPHFHVGLVLDPKALGKKNILNRYSYNYKSGIAEIKAYFSKEEILIQKVWYLLLNGERVNKKNIDNIESIREKLNENVIDDIGYSCKVDSFSENTYKELFKYITKERDEKKNILTYDNFVALYYGLYRVKQIQGYGCLYKITDEVDLDEYEAKYEEFIETIRKEESPERVYEKPQELISDTQYKLYSRKSYYKYLKKLYHEES